MTTALRNRILDLTRSYGTGRDTLRCLALATLDHPMKPENMDLENSSKFAEYEVINITILFYFCYLTKTFFLKAKYDFCRRCRHVGSST